MQAIETERLRLRHLQLADAAFIFELVNDPSWLRYIGDKQVRSLDDARAYLANGPLDSYRRLGYGLYCVELRSSGAAIGLCGLIKRDTLPDVDIGFALLPAHVGHGYTLEAARAVIALGQLEFGLRRLLAITQPDNAASIAVLTRLGLQRQGEISVAGTATPLLLFAYELG